MSQITSGLRRFLAVPFVYDLFEHLVGVTFERKFWIREYLKPFPGARILDIGCGTAALLEHLPGDVEYTGFDLSQAYIDAARKRYGARGRFLCAGVEAWETTVGPVGGYDIVMAFGVLHHLDDDQVRGVLKGVRGALRPGGRFVTLDPAYVPGQTALSRFVISRDRGQNVRPAESYAALAREIFGATSCSILPKLLRIPADNVALVCRG